LLQKLTNKTLNIVSDSAYVVGRFPAIETALISTIHKVMKTLSTLQHLIQTRTYPLYVTHIGAHSNLPGPLVRGNDIADKLTCTVFSFLKKEHQHLHTNANRLHVHYKIPLHTAHDIVKSCLYVLLYIVDLTHLVLILKVYVLMNYGKWI
jgi:hypothetical protein